MSDLEPKREFWVKRLLAKFDSSPGALAPTLTGCVLLLVSGVVHGRLTGRWESPEDSPIVSRIKTVPAEIGSWQAVRDTSIAPEFEKLAGISSYVQRTYRDRLTGASVTMMLMCGETGPISVHPPEACYAGKGFKVVPGSRRSVSLATEDGTISPLFNAARFSKSGVLEAAQPELFWAWSDDGNWRTPENPRYEFAGSPVLCKLYVTWDAPLPERSSKAKQRAVTPPEEFLALLVPELTRTVFTTPEVSGR